MIRSYYEEEMRYLHEAGKAFAQTHPDQARYLNVDSLTDRDPYVERLFEGFAFLSGRIRERLDDELPQYTEHLFRLLHPHFVHPVPALSILEFTPRPGLLQETTVLERGVEVRSRPVGEEATACRFTTAYPVQLQPIKLLEAKLEYPDSATSAAVLRFQLDRGVAFEKLDLKQLRLFFRAEPATASMMRLFFAHHVTGLTLEGAGATVQRRGPQWVEPVGFAAGEELLPSSRYSFSGYRLLQEYFSFRPKFWFVDLLGLGALALPAGTTAFTVRVHFDRPYPEDHAFRTENVRLFCTPIINLFERDAEPIRLTHRTPEYRVVADAERAQSVTVYDVGEVSGIEDASGRRHAYKPFFSFTHAEGAGRFFAETARSGPSGVRETYVSVGGFGEAIRHLPAETLSLSVRCTNADVPRENLQEGSINQVAPGFANLATFQNLTQPTRALPPPTRAHPQYHWKLVSLLALNRTSVATTEALLGLLRLFDWTDTRANERRLAGLRDVRWAAKETLHRGGILRGAEVTLDVQDGHFADEGDLHLFGSVMSTFLSTYATINSFVHLTIVSTPSGKRCQWEPQSGHLPLA